MNRDNGRDPRGTSSLRIGLARIQLTYLGPVGLGLVGWVVGGAAMALPKGPTPLETYLLGGLVGSFAVIGWAVWTLREAPPVPHQISPYDLIQSGRLAEASAALDQLNPQSERDKATVCQLRCMIAVRRGDLTEALSHIGAATERTLDWKEWLFDEVQQSNARGYSAWLRAAMGDIASAEREIQSVRSNLTNQEGFALASLAEALVHLQAGALTKLTALLKRDRLLLMVNLQPQERALVRAMGRMLRNVGASHPGAAPRAPIANVDGTTATPKGAATSVKQPPSEWVSRVAPPLSPFAPTGFDLPHENRGFAPWPAAQPDSKVAYGAVSTPAKVSGSGVRSFVYWAALIMFFVGTWKYLQPPKDPADSSPPVQEEVAAPPSGASGSLPFAAITAFAAILTAGTVFQRVRKQRADVRKLYVLQYEMLVGKDGEPDLVQLSMSNAELIAAQAERLRAKIADRLGDIPSSLAHIDAALAKIQTYKARLTAADLVTPDLAAARAYALAALQRPEDAAAELSRLPSNYDLLSRMRFVVPLIAFVAEGDLESAGRLVAATSPHLSLGYRDELLREIVRAVTSPGSIGASELSALHDEFLDREEDRRWMMRVTPALVERFDAAVSHVEPKAD